MLASSSATTSLVSLLMVMVGLHLCAGLARASGDVTSAIVPPNSVAEEAHSAKTAQLTRHARRLGYRLEPEVQDDVSGRPARSDIRYHLQRPNRNGAKVLASTGAMSRSFVRDPANQSEIPSWETESRLMTPVSSSFAVLVPAFIGLFWSRVEWRRLKRIEMGKDNNSMQSMIRIAGFIEAGAAEFLNQEYRYLTVVILLAAAIIGPVISLGTMISFIVGSMTSGICGYVGMKTAVFCNIRTTYCCWQHGPRSGFDVAIRGGSVMGFCLVSLGVMNFYILQIIYTDSGVLGRGAKAWEALAGFGLGGSVVALFARVGGGIYTKAADVGADLSGKNSFGMEEDDPRNPACIADNVGDNVGDIAGMGADLFGSFAESTCASLVVVGAMDNTPRSDGLKGLAGDWAAMTFPLQISSTGIIAGLLSLLMVRWLVPVNKDYHIERTLKVILLVTTILETPLVILAGYMTLPMKFLVSPALPEVEWWMACMPVLVGLWSGLIIGVVTEYHTSHSYRPVRDIAESQKISAATGIIFGLALGYMSCVVPTIFLAITIVTSYKFCGMYGISLAALGMLSTLTVGLAIDGFGPISDNAGGLAEMARLPSEVRVMTDALDAAGNTTAAIGKGFAIGSAALVSLALFGAYCESASVLLVDLLNPWCFAGLLVGAMLPFAFSAMTMRSVGQAANEIVEECFEQFPRILSGEQEPDYQKCIAISTVASLREMMVPGFMVVLTPVLMGVNFGKNCTAGLLAGALASGIMMATSMSNSGGAWDNAKKYIRAGGLGAEHAKGEAHRSSVTGDTVGDPMKDTSGPSLNILIKLSAITSLIFAPIIMKMSNGQGGPLWLRD